MYEVYVFFSRIEDYFFFENLFLIFFNRFFKKKGDVEKSLVIMENLQNSLLDFIEVMYDKKSDS